MLRTLLVLLLIIVSVCIINHVAADEFPTLASIESGTVLKHRIAFGSCFNPFRGGLIWSLMKRFNPNQLLLLGDQFYADYNPKNGFKQRSNPQLIENGYKGLFGLSSFQSLLASLTHTMMATYDDHDYGSNNHDKTFEYRDESQRLFEKYMTFFNPVQPHNAMHKSGVYSSETFTIPLDEPSRKAFRYKVVMLDSRSNKDPMYTKNGDFLGEQQWQWLEHELSSDEIIRNQIDMILVGSSIQVLPTEKLVEESWVEFPAQRDRLLQLLTKAKLYTHIFLLSGDIHNAEINQLKCQELTQQEEGASSTNEYLSEENRMVELTSSGLSHTFMKVTKMPSKEQSSTTSPTDVDVDTEMIVIPTQSRGMFMELVNGLYQVIYPAYYREARYAHSYGGIHFGLLDIVQSNNKNNQNNNNNHNEDIDTSSTLLYLLFRVIDHSGKTAMYKTFPLPSPTTTFPAFTKHSIHQIHPTERSTWETKALERIQCIPYWGEISMWRILLFRAIVVIAMMCCVLLPLCFLGWLLFASMYYIFMGAELTRQQKIEEQYQLNKEKMQ